MIHVLGFSFQMDGEQLYTNVVFKNLRMPLFFFICGFLVYKANFKWNIGVYKEMLMKKVRVQIIPTFILGSLYTLFVFQGSIYEFIVSQTKLGYWFTISLFEMFVIYYTMNLILQSIYRNKEIPSKVFDGVLAVTAVVIYCCMYLNKNLGYYILSLYFTCKYFIFFAIGILVAKYKKEFFKAICREKWIITSLLIFSILTFLTSITNDKLVEYVYVNLILTEHFLPNAMALSGIFFVFCFCHKNQHLLDSSSFVGRKLQYIGKRTLDIYLLHYFFIPKLPMVGTFIKNADSLILEFVLSLIVSIMIIVCCLLFSKIIKTSSILGYYLLGNKSK